MSTQAADYERHAEEQRGEWSKLSPLERLRWLQQAKEFARRYLGAAAKPAAGKSPR